MITNISRIPLWLFDGSTGYTTASAYIIIVRYT